MDHINTLKFSLPRLTGILPRPQLNSLLNDHCRRRLTLIVGQAAQGKSTLAGVHAASLDVPATWIRIDRGDADAVNFYLSLVLGLQHTFAEIDFKSQLTVPASGMGPREEGPRFREWVKALFAPLMAPVRLYLDNLEAIDPDSSALRLLKILIDQAPPQVRFTIMSRTYPRLAMETRVIRREAYVLSGDELAFSCEETQAFFRQVYPIRLTDMQIQRIWRFTEGWIGGLILLGELLGSMDERTRHSYLDRQLPDQFKTRVFRFFGDEIFNAQADAVQEVLLKSAIFEEVDPQIAATCIAVKDLKPILNQVADQNQFVQVVIGEDGRWRLRYHNLFHDFLLARLESTIGRREVHALHRNAATAYENEGNLEQAVAHYLEGKAFTSAAAVMERAGMVLLQSGRNATLSNWLEALPEVLINENAWLLYYLAMTRRFTEARENGKRLQRAYALFTELDDTRGRMLTLAMLIETAMIGGSDPIPMARMLDQAESLQRSTSADSLAFERSLLWLQMAFGYTLREAKPATGDQACQHAYLLAKGMGATPLEANALIYALLAQAMAGRLDKAQRTVVKIERLLDRGLPPELRTLYTINLFQLYNLNGELEKAKDLIEAARSDVQHLGLVYLYPAIQLQYLCLLPQLDAFAQAEEIGQGLINLTESLGHPFYNAMARLFMGISHYRKGAYDVAEELISRAMAYFSSDQSHSPSHLFLGHLVMGMIHSHRGDYCRAQEALNATLVFPEFMQNPLTRIHYHLAMGMLEGCQQNLDAASDHLGQALETAGQNGINHVMWLNRRDVAQICLLALKLGVNNDEAVRLLVKRPCQTAISGLEALMTHGHRKVKAQAAAARKAIHRIMVGPIEIQTLGDFQVHRQGAAMAEADWQRSQAKTLLKAIVARGSTKVLKDLLMADLWPESDTPLAERSFKVTLHRLRRSLEPEMNKTFGSCYVHLRQNLLSLDGELCMVDADRFAALIRQGKAHEQDREPQKATGPYQKAVDLYQGPFLPQDLYSSWATARRDHLTNHYIEALIWLAKDWEKRGDLKSAADYYNRAVNADPLSEESYRHLMGIYLRQDRRSRAIKTYQRCLKALAEQIDTVPQPSTQALYQQILESLPKN